MFKCFRRNSKAIEKIKIRDDFLNSPPSYEKVIQKTADCINGQKLPPIYIDDEYYLIDGYCSYLIAKTLHTKVKIVQVRNTKMGKEIELKKIPYEKLQYLYITANYENRALRGCLESCYKHTKEIADFAETHDFVGDMLILGTANNVLKEIQFILNKE